MEVCFSKHCESRACCSPALFQRSKHFRDGEASLHLQRFAFDSPRQSQTHTFDTHTPASGADIRQARHNSSELSSSGAVTGSAPPAPTTAPPGGRAPRSVRIRPNVRSLSARFNTTLRPPSGVTSARTPSGEQAASPAHFKNRSEGELNIIPQL